MTTNPTENKIPTQEENQAGIENHKTIATHLDIASKLHLDAAKYHEDGNHQKANESALAAKEQFKLAYQAQKKDILLNTPAI